MNELEFSADEAPKYTEGDSPGPRFESIFKRNIEASIAAKQSMLRDRNFMVLFAKAAYRLVNCFKNGGRLYIAGNGGSAADAQHLATEFTSKLARPRAPLAAEALTTDSSTLTAIGNDFGFEMLFSRQLLGKMTEKDVFMAITTSGNSPNILEALALCQKRDWSTIVLTGNNGGKLLNLSDLIVIAPGTTTSQIQESHQVFYHSLCESVESEIFFYEKRSAEGAGVIPPSHFSRDSEAYPHPSL